MGWGGVGSGGFGWSGQRGFWVRCGWGGWAGGIGWGVRAVGFEVGGLKFWASALFSG